MVKIAMLGSGFIARFYADSILGQRSRDKIVAVYSRRKESADKFAKDAKVGYATDEQGIPDGYMGLDVGPLSRKEFNSTVLEAKTILWNGQVIHQLQMPIDALTTLF